MTIIFNNTELSTLTIIGLIAGLMLLLIAITKIITSVVNSSQTKHRHKIIKEETNKQLFYKNEMQEFITKEIQRQLVENGLTQEQPKYYQPEFRRQ